MTDQGSHSHFGGFQFKIDFSEQAGVQRNAKIKLITFSSQPGS